MVKMRTARRTQRQFAALKVKVAALQARETNITDVQGLQARETARNLRETATNLRVVSLEDESILLKAEVGLLVKKSSYILASQIIYTSSSGLSGYY